MTTEEIVSQLQQIVNALQQIVQASSEMAERVATLESQTDEKLGVLTKLEGHLQILIDSYRDQVKAQEETNRAVMQVFRDLESRIEILEAALGRSPGGRPN